MLRRKMTQNAPSPSHKQKLLCANTKQKTQPMLHNCGARVWPSGVTCSHRCCTDMNTHPTQSGEPLRPSSQPLRMESQHWATRGPVRCSTCQRHGNPSTTEEAQPHADHAQVGSPAASIAQWQSVCFVCIRSWVQSPGGLSSYVMTAKWDFEGVRSACNLHHHSQDTTDLGTHVAQVRTLNAAFRGT
jgi:hypothetical protein